MLHKDDNDASTKSQCTINYSFVGLAIISDDLKSFIKVRILQNYTSSIDYSHISVRIVKPLLRLAKTKPPQKQQANILVDRPLPCFSGTFAIINFDGDTERNFYYIDNI